MRDLNDAFDLSQPAISHHMKALHEVGPADEGKRKEDRDRDLEPGRDLKSVSGRPLTGSNLASSAALNCESFKRSPASGYPAFRGLKS